MPANAVARVENLEFLTDVVPKTVSFKQFKQKQAKDSAQANGAAKGQGTLDGHMGGAKEEQATNGASHEAMQIDDDEPEGDEAEEELDEETKSPEPAQHGDEAMEEDHA